MKPAVVTLALAIALGGCAAPTVKGAKLGLAWQREDGDGAARLALSDQRLTLACRTGSGAVDVAVLGSLSAGAVLEIHSGKLWNTYPGAGYGQGRIRVLQTRLAAADPVLLAFADTGDLSVVFDDQRFVAPHDFAKAHDFIAACRLPTP